MVDRTYGLITYYRIERHMLDEQGAMRQSRAGGTIVEEVELPQGQYLTSDAFAKKKCNRQRDSACRRYRYKVALKRTMTGDHEFDALSNILSVAPSSVTSGVETVNPDFADNFVMQAVVRDGNLEVTANAELGKLSIFAVNGRLMAVSKRKRHVCHGRHFKPAGRGVRGECA